jgi:drug/metabolite transporter (DMT)-like permease
MKLSPHVLALGALVLWGTLATLGTLLVDVPPFLLVGVTLLVGGLPALPRWRSWRVPFPTLCLGVYGIFLYHFCLFMAFRLAPPVEANLINYLWPLLIVLLSPVVLPTARLDWRHVAGALMGFCGAALVVGGGGVAFNTAALPGYGLALAAAFIWSSYTLMCRRVPPFPSSAVGLFCVVSGGLGLLSHVALEPAYLPRPTEWGLLLLLGLGPMGAAFYLWDAAFKTGDARTLGTLSYLTPLLSTGMLALSGKGTLGFHTLAALVLIVGGAVLSSVGRSVSGPLPARAPGHADVR